MRCGKVKRRLSAYLDKELPKRKIAPIESHLNECLNCRQELSLLRELPKVLKLDAGMEPSPYFESCFWRRVAEEKERRRIPLDSLSGLLRPVPVFAQIAIVALAGILLGAGIGQWASFSSSRQELRSFLELERFHDSPPDSISRTHMALASGISSHPSLSH